MSVRSDRLRPYRLEKTLDLVIETADADQIRVLDAVFSAISQYGLGKGQASEIASNLKRVSGLDLAALGDPLWQDERAKVWSVQGTLKFDEN